MTLDRPPSPEPQFLAYLLAVLDEHGHVMHRLGRCREALCHRVNRLEAPPRVLKELLQDAGGAAWRDLEWAEATARMMRNRIWARLKEVKAA